MTLIFIISIIIIIVVILLSVLTVNKGYQYKHTIDPAAKPDVDDHLESNTSTEKKDNKV